MLQKVHDFWVKGVLENSLHKAALIDLGMAYQPDAVAYPWEMVVERPDAMPQPLPQGTPIANVFDELRGELLILGSPGSGKTTMLLELTRTLIERAQQEETHPIPVVFNLSSWAEQRPPLADWLVEELNARYDVPRKVGQAWIDHDQMLPLLDGLDEVRQEARDSCVAAINAYRQEHGMVGMVVCSRVADYAALTAKLKLRGAIMVQPLTDEQIDSYLAQTGDQLVAVRTLLHEDAEMRVFANTPLLLNIVTLAYQGADTSGLVGQPPEERRRRLFDTYVQRMLERRPATKDKRYTPEQTRQWLAWLAKRMVEHDQTVFYLEQMQPTWLSSHRWLYELVVGLGVRLVFGLVGMGVFGLAGAVSGILVGRMVFGPDGALVDIEPVEKLRWSRQRTLARAWWQLPLLVLGFGLVGWLPVAGDWLGGLVGGLVFGLGGGLGSGLGSGLSGRQHSVLFGVLFGGLVGGLVDGLVGGLVGGLSGGLYLVVINGFVADEIADKTHPNQGIDGSLDSASFIVLFGGLVGGLVGGLSGGLSGGLNGGLVGGLVGGLGVGGGLAVIQHYTLRFVLRIQGFIPRDYVRFLDHAAERILLRKVGGGYIFVHRMLLEYFAGLEEEKPRKNDAPDDRPT
jgi:DNA polymerase III delta prime subunit